MRSGDRATRWPAEDQHSVNKVMLPSELACSLGLFAPESVIITKESGGFLQLIAGNCEPRKDFDVLICHSDEVWPRVERSSHGF